MITSIPFAFPGLSGVLIAFTTRKGGGSSGVFAGANLSLEVGDDDEAVAKNRKEVQRQLGFSGWAEVRQVHGLDMLVEPNPVCIDKRAEVRADGMITSRSGLALVVKSADCQPILLAHESGKHVAALHCGWRGNRQGFPQKGVAAMCTACGLEPQSIFAVRGPSLGPGASEFINFELEWGNRYRGYYSKTTNTMDLWRLTRDQLLQAGLLPERIFAVDHCTHSLPCTFFSYRRDGITGRQAGLIWIADR